MAVVAAVGAYAFVAFGRAVGKSVSIFSSSGWGMFTQPRFWVTTSIYFGKYLIIVCYDPDGLVTIKESEDGPEKIVKLRFVKEGMLIETGRQGFQRVERIARGDSSEAAVELKFRCDAGEIYTTKCSAAHMLSAGLTSGDVQMKTAGSFKVGDTTVVKNGISLRTAKCIGVRKYTMTDRICPIVEAGSIVVNKVLGSCFCAYTIKDGQIDGSADVTVPQSYLDQYSKQLTNECGIFLEPESGKTYIFSEEELKQNMPQLMEKEILVDQKTGGWDMTSILEE